MSDSPTPPPSPIDPLAEPPQVQPELPPPAPPAAAVPPPPPQPPRAQPNAAGRPTPEQVKAQIHQTLIEGEMRLRNWMNTPQGRETIERAKVIAPAAALGLAGVAAAFYFWNRSKTTRQATRRWDDVRRTFEPIGEEKRPSLTYLRDTLIGEPADAVESLLGPPTTVALDGLIWQYRLDAAVGDHSPDPAAVEVAFNDDGEVGEVTFLMRPEDQ